MHSLFIFLSLTTTKMCCKIVYGEKLMNKEIKEYRMQKYLDIMFVKCTFNMKDGSPYITVVAKEPAKELRIMPFYEENKFNEYVAKFAKTYNFSKLDLYDRLLKTIFVDDENKEYRIVCNDKSISFSVEYDPLRCYAVMRRSDIEDYPPIEPSL